MSIVLSTALLSTVACDTSSTRLRGASLRVAYGQVDFTEQFPFDWSRLFIFGPYSPRETVESTLGFKWPEYEDSSVAYSDSVCLVVFVSNGAVVGWYEQPRSIDLDALQNEVGYSRHEAVFAAKWSDGRVLVGK